MYIISTQATAHINTSEPSLARHKTPQPRRLFFPPVSSLLAKHRGPEALNLHALDGPLAGSLEQARPGLGVLGADGLLGGAGAQAALLLHGDGGAGLEAGALRDEGRGEAGVAGLEGEVEEGLGSGEWDAWLG